MFSLPFPARKLCVVGDQKFGIIQQGTKPFCCAGRLETTQAVDGIQAVNPFPVFGTGNRPNNIFHDAAFRKQVSKWVQAELISI